ncbi:DUF1467 family protein [Sphingomonas ginkgonis]|uniref:DUF1467 family protein n=1 Tax=Sphingomonas ginkgonis TaxID=2315330 RepID=A0A429VAU2_9SPHN|nr:DUF1467 family protein [Sphingomonas ginkgonis]RST30962.1 DUF1467 family protein [Sphingomonas ginkgonis]
MKWTSISAIYFLFWTFSAFVLLPFGVRTSEEAGEERIPGQADSAPHRFDLSRHLLRTTVVATALFALYYLNWTFGWIGTDAFDFYHPN